MRCSLNCYNCLSAESCPESSIDDPKAYMVECAVRVAKPEWISSASGMLPLDFFAEDHAEEFSPENGFIVEGGCEEMCPYFERCDNDACCGCRLPVFGKCLVVIQLFDELGVEIGDRAQHDTEDAKVFVSFGPGRRVFVAPHEDPHAIQEFIAA